MRLDKRLYSNFSSEGINITGFIPNKRKRFSFVLYPVIQEMFEKYTTADPLLFIRNGEAFISIPFNVPSKPTKSQDAIGIDLGEKRFATTSDGVVFDDKEYKKKRRQVRYLRRSLAKKGTKSAKRHLKKIKHKERNLSKTYIEKVVDDIISTTDASHIILEDLTKIKQSTARFKNGYLRKKHNSMISQVPFYMFKRILSYKAQLAGKRVETVSPKWTSQIDSRTNKRDGKRQGCRYYCADGTVLDADWNAAINILKRSKRPTSNLKVPIDGTLTFFAGQGDVNRPIVDTRYRV